MNRDEIARKIDETFLEEYHRFQKENSDYFHKLERMESSHSAKVEQLNERIRVLDGMVPIMFIAGLLTGVFGALIFVGF